MNKLLTESVREVLEAQYPNEDLVEVDGYIYHVPSTKQGWEILRDKVRPGWEVMKEERGLKHYIIYDPKHYRFENISGDCFVRCIDLSEDIEIPVNCSSCYMMFHDVEFPDGFKFQKTFDTSEVVCMSSMFRESIFFGNMSLGKGFNTDKVKNFGYMFFGTDIKGNLDLGIDFSIENASHVDGMFSCSIIQKPIRFGDKFNLKKAIRLNNMFYHTRMPEGFNIGNNFHVQRGATICYMFSNARFNEDFRLPSCFDVTEETHDYLAMFRNATLPKRIKNRDTGNVREIVNRLKL